MSDVKCHILFVEDHEDTQELVTLLLAIEGYKVTSARTVAEALRLAQNGDFHLYLLDGRLPDGDSEELIRRLREFDARTPIVVYSAVAYEVDKQRALAAGAQAYIVKPSGPQELEQVIAEILEGECVASGA